MKQILLLSFFLSIFPIGFSQDTVILYLDKDFERTEKEVALFLRTAIINNNHYYITDQYINGKMINYGEYISINPWIEDGLSKHYNVFGQLYSTGKYINGRISGQWIYYSYKKTDTVDYSFVDNYYRFLKDSCKLKQQIIETTLPNNDTLKIKENLKSFIQSNLHLPARTRGEGGIANCELNISLIIDTTGYIKCPEIFNSNNIDYDYEALRV